MKFLAADLGASSGRTIVGTIQDGRISLAETHRFTNEMSDRDGERHWDVDRLLQEIKAGIAKSGAVAGIGIDTWGVDFGLIDAAGKLLDQPFAYRDPRHEKAMPAVYEKVSRERLYALTGLQEMPFNSIYQVMAEARFRPELLARARHLLFMPELLSYLLTGEVHHEYSIASTSGLLDAQRRTWSDELLGALGYPRDIFGQVEMPGAAAGSYQGTPVFLPAMHDTGSAVAAVPASGEGWAYLSSGTWSLIGAELAEPVLTPQARAANFTNEGGAGGRIRFLKNVNGLWLIQECQRQWRRQGQELSFAAIAAAAAATPDFASVVDPNEARFMMPENMLEAIAGYCRETGQAVPQTVGEFARCCYQSLAQAYRQQMLRLHEVTGKTFTRLHIVGGGCQAELLNQLTADACGITVLAGPVEATALGNLCLQAQARGQFRDLEEIRAAIARSFPPKVYQPRG